MGNQCATLCRSSRGLAHRDMDFAINMSRLTALRCFRTLAFSTESRSFWFAQSKIASSPPRVRPVRTTHALLYSCLNKSVSV